MKPPYRKRKPLADHNASSKKSMAKLRVVRKIARLVDMFMDSTNQKMYRDEFIEDLFKLIR